MLTYCPVLTAGGQPGTAPAFLYIKNKTPPKKRMKIIIKPLKKICC